MGSKTPTVPNLHPATPADFPAIERIARATWPGTFGDILSPEQIEYMLAMMYSLEALREQTEQLGHRFLLLREGETAVGYTSYQLDYRPGTTKIHKIYLLPQTQGKGYGRALIEAVVERARAAGQQRLRLDVNYQNPAVGFYEYLGFRTIERIDTHIGNGYLMEDYVMEMGL
jgi:ribosomal protein S18 acetylase RimI-like enzyme